MKREPFLDAASVGFWEIIISAPVLLFCLVLIFFSVADNSGRYGALMKTYPQLVGIFFGIIALAGLLAGLATLKNIYLGALLNSVLVGLIVFFTWPIFGMILYRLPSVSIPPLTSSETFEFLVLSLVLAGLQGVAFFLSYFFIRNIYFSNLQNNLIEKNDEK